MQDDQQVIYEVRLELDPQVPDKLAELDEWLPGHIDAMLALPGFVRGDLVREEPVDEPGDLMPWAVRTVHYVLQDRAALEAYFADHADRMQADGRERFGQWMRATRRILATGEGREPEPTTAGLCKNCNQLLLGQYCRECGQRDKNRMISLWELFRDFLGDAFELDSRLWRTMFPLLFKPGYLTAEYLRGRRVHYTPPLRMYLVISLFLFFVLATVPGIRESLTVEADGDGDVRVGFFTDDENEDEPGDARTDAAVDEPDTSATAPADATGDATAADSTAAAEADEAGGKRFGIFRSEWTDGSATGNWMSDDDSTADENTEAADDREAVPDVTETADDDGDRGLPAVLLPPEARDAMREAAEELEAEDPEAAAELEELANSDFSESECDEINLDVNFGNEAWNTAVKERLIGVCRRVAREGLSSLKREIMGNLPTMMFVFLPLIALTMKTLYLFSKRYYVEHLLFFVHYHSFAYLTILLLALLGQVAQPFRFLEGPLELLSVVVAIYIPFYLYRAMRVVYGQGRLMTIAKFIGLLFAYFSGLTVVFVFGVLATALTWA